MQTDNIIYSATMLQDYVECPRRFQLKYILNQSWPSIPIEPILELEQLSARGRQFHFLAHQFFAGVSIPAIVSAITDATLRHWFDRFLEFAQAQKWLLTMSETRLAAPFDQHHIIAVYDLIARTQDEHVHIFDWKTSFQPPKESVMARRMQTIIYPFVLYENLPRLFPTSENDQKPALAMHYWYPEYPDSSITLTYDPIQHQENTRILSDLIEEIDTRCAASHFPLTDEKKRCKYCQYRSLCDRGIDAGRSEQDSSDYLTDIVDIDFNMLPDINADI